MFSPVSCCSREIASAYIEIGNEYIAPVPNPQIIMVMATNTKSIGFKMYDQNRNVTRVRPIAKSNVQRAMISEPFLSIAFARASQIGWLTIAPPNKHINRAAICEEEK